MLNSYFLSLIVNLNVHTCRFLVYLCKRIFHFVFKFRNLLFLNKDIFKVIILWELRKEDSFEIQQSWLVSPCPNWSMEKWMSVILRVGIYSWENTSEDTPDILPIISGLLCLYFYIFDFILYVAARMFLKNTNLLILLSCLKFFGGFHSAFKTL